MAMSLEISIKRGRDQSSAPKTLSYGEKIVKIGPVHPEIFDKIRRTRPYLIMYIQRIIPFCFWMPEWRMKVVDFYVAKMLQN